ncbi:MAG TPA: pyridoxal phosphate-dependent aminotransferase [Acidimicrobiales bacterium]|nr:pyridoxal phosphate-dependent aminotransferase [Acidimicrobiales bacterium]
MGPTPVRERTASDHIPRFTAPWPSGLAWAQRSQIERWFALAGPPGRFDLARSGAPPRTTADLLALASPEDVDEYLSMSLDYGPGIGSDRLRTAISALTGAPSPAVIVTTGAVEALLLACAGALGPRLDVAVATPAYEGLLRAVEAAGGRARPVRVWEPGAERLDLAALAGLELSRYAAVLVNLPHNPTGLGADPAELADLARRCGSARTALIVDRVSAGTLDDGAGAQAEAPGGGNALIVIGDVSKAFGLGGLRVGWCVTTNPERHARMCAVHDLTTLAASGPSQHLAAIALENRRALSVAAMARANRGRLVEWVASIPGGRLVPPADGLVAFPRIPMGSSSRPFAARLLETRSVSVTPGSFFGHDDHLRLGLGLGPAQFDQALKLTAEALGSRAA